MKIRGKFQLQSEQKTCWYDQRILKFGAVYDPSIPEDQKYSEATPSGSVEMQVKPTVAEQFKIGQFYYLDFTPVEEAAQAE